MNVLWMLVASLLFSLMGVFIKLAASRYGVAEMVFYRSLFGFGVLYVFARAKGWSLATPFARFHVLRGVTGTIALTLWFYATTQLPLGTSMTLNYTSPLFLAAFTVAAALRSRRVVEGRLIAAIGVGFIGVILVLQPSFSHEQGIAAIAGLASGVFSAAAYWNVRELGRRGEPEWRTVLYFSLAGTVLGIAGSLVTGLTPHDLRGALLLLAIGSTATLAQLAMTRAYARASTLATANLQYTAIVFATILGILIFGDRIGTNAWLGIAIIIFSGIASTAMSVRRSASTKGSRP